MYHVLIHSTHIHVHTFYNICSYSLIYVHTFYYTNILYILYKSFSLCINYYIYYSLNQVINCVTFSFHSFLILFFPFSFFRSYNFPASFCVKLIQFFEKKSIGRKETRMEDYEREEKTTNLYHVCISCFSCLL